MDTMRLVSFQVKDCFGFQDSGVVNLNDASNLIYVLGRNSSGKTAFLSALAHFSPERTPRDDSRFVNFDASGRSPTLTARFEIDGEGLSVETLAEEATRITQEANQADPVVSSSSELQRYRDAIHEGIMREWSVLAKAVRASGSLWVWRAGDGEYSYCASDSLSDSDSLGQKTREMLDAAWHVIHPPNAPSANQALIGGAWRQVNQLTVSQVSKALAYQLPHIEWLTGKRAALPLDADLPDKLMLAHLDGKQDALTEAMIELLGREKLRIALTTDNLERQRTLEAEFREAASNLSATINRSDAGIPDLIEIDLKCSDGLRVNIIANGKRSYYRQISENTKFLFAYYLYRAANKLQSAILLFDEPSNGFHATAQEQLLKFLQALGREGNLVIVSTHSEHLIDTNHLTGIRPMDTDNDGYLRVRNEWHGRPTGDADVLALQPLVDAIGMKYGTNKLVIGNKVIIVEGVTDLAYLRAFHQILHCSGDLHIAPARGAETIPYVVALIISQGLSFKVVIDEGKDSSQVKTQLVRGYGIPEKFIYEIPIPTAFVTSATGAGIEDVFSKADFESLLNQAGVPIEEEYPYISNSRYMSARHRTKYKAVVADWLLQHVGSCQEAEFDAATLEGMRAVMDFCMNDDWLLR